MEGKNCRWNHSKAQQMFCKLFANKKESNFTFKKLLNTLQLVKKCVYLWVQLTAGVKLKNISTSFLYWTYFIQIVEHGIKGLSYSLPQRPRVHSPFNFNFNLSSSLTVLEIVTSLARSASTVLVKIFAICQDMNVRSREYMFTHMNCSTVDIPFISEVLSGERIWVISKVANLMRRVWWLGQEEKEKKEKKLIWRFA